MQSIVTTYLIFMVVDSHGTSDYDVTTDSSNTIQICGMEDANGISIYFESDAYHLLQWCEDHGLTYSMVERTETHEVAIPTV